MVAATSFIFWHGNLVDDLSRLNFHGHDLQQVDGRVTRIVKDPHFVEIGFEHGMDKDVYSVHYSYKTLEGITENGSSYCSETFLEIGDIVPVEYPKEFPMVSRIKGMGMNPTRIFIQGKPFLPALVAIFLLLGWALVVSQLRRGAKLNRLFKHGKLAEGQETSRKRTFRSPYGSIHRNPHFYKVTFAFTAASGQEYQVESITDQHDDLLNGQGKRVLYDPYKPSIAIMLDDQHLPGSPLIDKGGKIRTVSPAKESLIAVVWLLLAIIIVIGGGAHVCMNMFGLYWKL